VNDFYPPPPDEPPLDDRRTDRGVGNLEFLTIAQLRASVAARGPRQWLVRGVIVLGDYGVHGAEPKAGKTTDVADLCVSVASGTPWLGLLPVDTRGPVLMFVGEGGEGNTLRRLEAAAEARGVALDDLPIVVCARAPYLNDVGHLAQLEQQVNSQRPVLVTLDPLYLSARGAELGDLYKMGALLEAPQRICQRAGASLFVVTHFNRQAGSGFRRLTGAGPAEWGRFLITAEVKAKNHDSATGGTRILTEMQFTGGEIPEHSIRVNRLVWAERPEDLDSPLHTVTQASFADQPTPGEGSDSIDRSVSPAAGKLLEAIDALGGGTSTALVDWIANHHGHGLTRETVSRHLNAMEKSGLLEYVEMDTGRGFPTRIWTRVTTCDITRDDHTSDSRVTTCDRPYNGHAVTSHDHGHTSSDHDADHKITRAEEAS